MQFREMMLSDARRWAERIDQMSNDEFSSQLAAWKSGDIAIDNSDYQDMRALVYSAFVNAGGLELTSRTMYPVDVEVGLLLYEYLASAGFTEAEACNDGVWRYLTIKVFPDITYFRYPDPEKEVKEKGGRINHKRFFLHPRRIWLKTLWWYVHLSWQGSGEATRRAIEGNGANIIGHFIERPGKGYRLNLYRTLMKDYSLRSDKTDVLFRRLAKLSLAECRNMEPALLPGGEQEYCRLLFSKIDESDAKS